MSTNEDDLIVEHSSRASSEQVDEHCRAGERENMDGRRGEEKRLSRKTWQCSLNVGRLNIVFVHIM